MGVLIASHSQPGVGQSLCTDLCTSFATFFLWSCHQDHAFGSFRKKMKIFWRLAQSMKETLKKRIGMWSKHHNLINNPTSLGVKAKLPKVMAREGSKQSGRKRYYGKRNPTR
jgi:hypothetical protein